MERPRPRPGPASDALCVKLEERKPSSVALQRLVKRGLQCTMKRLARILVGVLKLASFASAVCRF